MIETLREFLITYPVLAPLIFVIVRTLPIIIAPIPGVVLDILGIAIFGWVYGLILGEIGIILGSAAAFLIGRQFREPVIKRFAAMEKVDEWEAKYSGNQKFWGLVVMRIATSPWFDYVSYAAGLTKIKFGQYIGSTIVGTAPLMFCIYYFGGLTLKNGLLTFAIFFATLFMILYVWKFVVKRGDKGAREETERDPAQTLDKK